MKNTFNNMPNIDMDKVGEMAGKAAQKGKVMLKVALRSFVCFIFACIIFGELLALSHQGLHWTIVAWLALSVFVIYRQVKKIRILLGKAQPKKAKRAANKSPNCDNPFQTPSYQNINSAANSDNINPPVYGYKTIKGPNNETIYLPK